MLPPSQLWLDVWRIWLYFAIHFVDDFLVDDPLTSFYFIEGGFAFLVFYVSPSLVWLNYLKSISPSSLCLIFFGIVIILFSCVLARLKFAVLVIFFKDLARSCRSCFRFKSIFSCIMWLFFLAEPVLFIFLFCLAYSNFLTLDSGCEGLGVGCFVSFDLSNVY